MYTHALVEMEVVRPHKTTIKTEKSRNGPNLTHGFAPRRVGWPLDLPSHELSLEIYRTIDFGRAHTQNPWTAHPYIRTFFGNTNM